MLELDYGMFNLVEYDWCLLDNNGHLAIMMTGGQGGIPRILVESNQETINAASQIILDSQILTKANTDIEDSESTKMHLEISQRGFYVYDAMYDSLNRYTRICTPQNKLHISNISKFYVDMLILYRFDGVFQDSSKI